MLKPLNRNILIDIKKTNQEKEEPLIVLPEDYKPEKQRYIEVSVLDSAEDVRMPLAVGDKLVVDRSMIEEIVLGPTIYNVILDSYVMGIVK